MRLLRIREVEVLHGYCLRLKLTDGSTVERDVSALMIGPAFEPLKRDPESFRAVRAEGGTVVWPNGADLCPDVVIWGGAPPEGAENSHSASETRVAPAAAGILSNNSTG
jgi:hypothetical protein